MYSDKLNLSPWGQQETLAQLNTYVPNDLSSAWSCQKLQPSSADRITFFKSKGVRGRHRGCSEVRRETVSPDVAACSTVCGQSARRETCFSLQITGLADAGRRLM